MTKPNDLTQRYATFLMATSFEDLPTEVRHEAKRSILNFVATALAGCREDAVQQTLASLSEFSGRPQATVIGRSERIDALSAAFLNAASARSDTTPATEQE